MAGKTNFRDFNKNPQRYFPSTYKEYRKIRMNFEPISHNDVYEQAVKQKENFAPYNPSSRYNDFVHDRRISNTMNPATQQRYGDWQNKYDEGVGPISKGYSDYPNECSVTAEPVDTNSYDALNQLQSTPLSRAFFSSRNIDFIRYTLSNIFFSKYGPKLKTKDRCITW